MGFREDDIDMGRIGICPQRVIIQLIPSLGALAVATSTGGEMNG
jgi:hypothetical protein